MEVVVEFEGNQGKGSGNGGRANRREDRPTMYYAVHLSEYGDVYPIRPDGTDGRWRVGEVAMTELLANGEVVFEEQSDGRIEAYRIIAAGTETSIAYPSMFDPEIVKTTAHGSIELRDILGAGQFAYPKPSSLIKEIVSLCTNDGDIVLDSFAGSETTAHAVLALNKLDGGKRKFILVECEDHADTVTAERVRRVINGVPGAQEGLGGSFTFCALGEPIDEEGMLTGEALPEFGALAGYLLYVSTGVSAGVELRAWNDDGLFYSGENRDYYLLYRADLEWLRSNEAMFNEEPARRIARLGRRAVVFGAGKYIGQRALTDLRIVFCQIPYEMHYPLRG